ncbi:MAG: hypothetical protein EHM33_11375 [Chloroflexi bacterium]|nr:MAG: hypothetical protein EHM33_11375 [Chloroflexota bacterium]
MSSKPDFYAAFAWQTARVFVVLVLLLGTVLIPAQSVQAAGTYTVNRADDIAPRGTGVTCITPVSSDCTLREAVIKANDNPDSTIQFAASLNGTPIVLTRIGNDSNSNAGDLDINANMTIIGNGSTNTIIQGAQDASYTNSIGDKVFGVNQDGAYNSLIVNFSGLTIRYGDNTVPAGDPSWAYTGGGVDIYQTGTDNVTTFTDCVISYNRNRNSYGGGLNFDQTGSGSLTLTRVTFDHNQTPNSYGGALNIFGSEPAITITDSTFTNNSTSSASQGGAIFYRPSYGGSLQIHGSIINGNTAGSDGGGIAIVNFSASTSVVIDQDTQITDNTAGGTGGGIYIDGSVVNTTSFTLSNILISGNTATGNPGGGIYVGAENLTLQYSRIMGNTASTGTGLYKYSTSGTGTVTAEKNWWGCSTGPGASPCDTAVTAGGTLDVDPWLRDQLTSSSGTTLATNQSSTLIASFPTSSANWDVVPANLAQIIGLPATWNTSNPSVGTLSSAQATIQSNGTATANFQATGVGAVYAQVDNDRTSGASSNILTTIKANTTTAIQSHTPDPSRVGEAVTVTVSVTGQYGNTPTAPTGTVTVTDGVDSCTVSLPATSCSIVLGTPGNRTLTASYPGDANFNASSANEAHEVLAVNQYTLDVSRAGTGNGTVTSAPAGINCGSDCSENYTSGTVVTLAAAPAGRSTFAGWSGDADCSDGSVTMNADISCIATFDLTHTVADFDGDGDTDLSVFKLEPWGATWYIKDQSVHAYGNSASIPVSCDYNGDGRADIAVYNAGAWYVEGLFVDNWGDGSSIPVPGDYDGDGSCELAVFKVEPWGGMWYIQGIGAYTYGNHTSIPVPADYNNDHVTDIAVYISGTWYVKDQFVDNWGDGSSVPLPGDYDGNGTLDLAVFKVEPWAGMWYIQNQAAHAYGNSESIPVPGDYNSDDQMDIAVYNAGTWYVKDQFVDIWGDEQSFPLPARR